MDLETRNALREEFEAVKDSANTDIISRSSLISAILEIDDVSLSPKALDRIMNIIAQMPPADTQG